jgi:hypothetical protein
MGGTALLIGWLTLAILAATAGIILWYTVETRRLRETAQQQVDLQIRPFITLRYDDATRRLVISNIGHGVARDIAARETNLTRGEAGPHVSVRWDSIDYLAPGQERELAGRSFLVPADGEEQELADKKRAWASNFGRHGQRVHRVEIDYHDVAGGRYTVGYRIERGRCTVESDQRVE